MRLPGSMMMLQRMRSRPGELPGAMVPPMTTSPLDGTISMVPPLPVSTLPAPSSKPAVRDRAVVQHQHAGAAVGLRHAVVLGADADADEAGVQRRAVGQRQRADGSRLRGHVDVAIAGVERAAVDQGQRAGAVAADVHGAQAGDAPATLICEPLPTATCRCPAELSGLPPMVSAAPALPALVMVHRAAVGDRDAMPLPPRVPTANAAPNSVPPGSAGR